MTVSRTVHDNEPIILQGSTKTLGSVSLEQDLHKLVIVIS